MKDCIKNYTFAEMEEIFAQRGEKSYRARQLYSWIYAKNVETFDEMSNYSKQLRTELARDFTLNALSLVDQRESKIDETAKYLFETNDGHFVEGVLLKNNGPEGGRITICVSCQVGCAMGCTFCETSKIGFKRNLTTAEILDQVCIIRRVSGLENNNIVFMGMGEPFMNYDNVLKAADILNYSFGFHIGSRKITISTCGLTDQLERYIEEKRPYNIAISLNDTLSEIRKKTMPVENKFPFVKLADMLKRKFPISRNRVTIEYVMRKDNISQEDARRIKNLFSFQRIKLNLIPLNGSNGGLSTPTEKEIEDFVRYLEIMNVPISIRKSLGSDIQGACGQLSGRRYLDAS